MGVSTGEWPQVEERVSLMPATHHHNNLHLPATAAGRAMNNQQALRCPRCDSSNTKFCYYNNYSLSQPRHFCKACRRYWTRGGTLRNVPVGGGCRKNKRIKRSSSASAAAVTDSPSLLRQISNVPMLQSSSTTVDPIFYGLIHNNGNGSNSGDLPSFLKRLEQRNLVCNLNSCTDLYDFNPNLSSLGLCFPTTATAATTHQDHNAVQLFHTQELGPAALVAGMASTSLLGSSSLSSSTATSLLAAGLRPQPKMGAVNNPSGWADIQGAAAANGSSCGLFKEEDGADVLNNHGRFEWQIPCDNSQLDNFGAVDVAPLYWNVNAAAGVGGGWTETATNRGSSIAPLI